MSIKDVPLSNISNTLLPVPPAPGFEKSLMSGKVPLAEDPQSGSILRALMENGFKEKIENGLGKGHTYNILHAAPSTDFTLVETWNETIIGLDGASIMIPKKNYQFFKIMDTPSTIPAPEEKPEISPIAPEQPENPDPVTKPEPAPEPAPKPAPANISEKAQEISLKIKNGGAGMTSDDWEFRNANWPAIEKFLLPETPVTSPVPVIVTEPEPVVITPSSTQEITEDSVIPEKPSAPVMQHHEAKNWLMERLGQGQVPAATVSLQENIDTEPALGTSYDLLKARFAKGVTPTPISAEQKPETASHTKQDLIESVFNGPIAGESLELWNLMQTIPARPFIYPTEYSWGTDAQGNPIERSLENYPLPAKKLREKISGIIEDLKNKGVDTEVLPIGDALKQAESLNLL